MFPKSLMILILYLFFVTHIKIVTHEKNKNLFDYLFATILFLCL